MKKQIILVPLLVLLAFNLKAQAPDPTYLNKALQQLESGNCDAAQLYYNAYKELTGDSISFPFPSHHSAYGCAARLLFL